jgi:hypothetical protein
LNLIEKIDTSRDAVKKTGKAFLIAGCFFSVLFLVVKSHAGGWTDWNIQQGIESSAWKWFLGVGAFLFVLSRVAYPVMKPIHIGWMTLAFALGWVNTRILLGVFFFLIVTPIGLIMRMLGKDLLSERIDRNAESYWIRRERVAFDPKKYERMF